MIDEEDDPFLLEDEDMIALTPITKTQDETPPSWLDALNEAQRQAVETLDGPLLVLAGAGTGKTRVLTTRLAYILAQKRAYPNQILCVTFTNKAALEMRMRVEDLINENTQNMWIGTFHSIGSRILRRHADFVGLTNNYTIIDSDDQIRLLKEICVDIHHDMKAWPPKVLNYYIQSWKDRALTPDQVPVSDYQGLEGSQLERIYPLYNERLLNVDAADFGDLLLHNITIFTQHHDILAKYQDRFRYILVDEYQDTNNAQYLWLRLLARAKQSTGESGLSNICCVGDDDQSIYSWRGADIENILRFEHDFKNANIVKLECNYRSTKAILGAASGLIAHNQGRYGKTLWTPKEGGEKVHIVELWNDREEAAFISQQIRNMHVKQDIGFDHHAILVRAGFQTRRFEEIFIQDNMPYRIIGGLRFYEREEARDAIAYMRLLQNDQDDLAFSRIINKPSRGIGNATQERIRVWARMKNISMAEAAKTMLNLDEIRGKAKKSLINFLNNLEAFRIANRPGEQGILARRLLEEMGYLSFWDQSAAPDAKGRLENLHELFRAMDDFPDLASFLEHVALVMENEGANSLAQVSIITLHGAKGLEFDYVYLPGWEEEIFPNPRALSDDPIKGLEEERRLAYVGITRAKLQATIIHTKERFVFGQTIYPKATRFIDELPKEHIERFSSLKQGQSHRQARHQQQRPRHYANQAKWRAGDRCFNQKFGEGTVRHVDGQHIMVTFDHAGDKLVFADFLKASG